MKTLSFDPLLPKRYPEMVAQTIQTKILGEGIGPGVRLPTEKELSDNIGVSRSVIREALRLLEAMGMVKMKKGRNGGIFVSDGYHEPWRDSLIALIKNGRVSFDDVFETRFVIEPYVATRACKHATDQDLAAIRSLISDSREHFEDAQRLRRNSLDFHIRLAKACGNSVLAMMVQSNLEILEELSLDYLHLTLEQHFVEVHEGILEAVELRDESLAEQRMRDDVQDVKNKLGTIMER